MHYFNIFITAVFIENLALAFFLGMCTFLAISKNVKTAVGLGFAVIVIEAITIPVNQLIYANLLKKGALTWANAFIPTEKVDFAQCIELHAHEFTASEFIGASSYACATVGFC